MIFEVGHGDDWCVDSSFPAFVSKSKLNDLFPPSLIRSPEEDAARLEDTLGVISEDNLIATSLIFISWDSETRQESIEDAVSLLT